MLVQTVQAQPRKILHQAAWSQFSGTGKRYELASVRDEQLRNWGEFRQHFDQLLAGKDRCTICRYEVGLNH